MGCGSSKEEEKKEEPKVGQDPVKAEPSKQASPEKKPEPEHETVANPTYEDKSKSAPPPLLMPGGSCVIAHAWKVVNAPNTTDKHTAWVTDLSTLDDEYHVHMGESEIAAVYESRFPELAEYEYSGPQGPIPVVIKEFTGDTEELEKDFLAETEAMKKISHPNIIRLLGFKIEDLNKRMVFEAYTHGVLQTYLTASRNSGGMETALLAGFARDIAAGMAFLEEHGVVHGDLATRNCVVDYNNKVRVGDYGLTRSKFPSDYSTFGGNEGQHPVRWMAPELLQDLNAASSKTDAWAYGVTVWEICTFGNRPYSKISATKGVIKHVMERAPPIEKPKASPPGLFEACEKCFDQNPKGRPMFATLFASYDEIAKAAELSLDTIFDGVAPGTPKTPRSGSKRSLALSKRSSSGGRLAYDNNQANGGGQDNFADKKNRNKSFRSLAVFKETENPGEEFAKVSENSKVIELDPKKISLEKELGQGAFGVVMKGKYTKPDGAVVPCACKTLKKKNADDLDALEAEALLVSQFDHPNVVACYGQVTQSEPAMIILEFMEKGSLYGVLTTPEADLKLKTLMLMAIDIACGMDYLALNGFVHRDLASRNILVGASNECKISDFGLSRDLDEDMYYESNGGMVPIRWTPPEAYKYNKYSSASDVWSYGITMYEIWTKGAMPYGSKWTNMNVMMQVENGYRLPPPANCPRAVYNIMLQCWNPARRARPEFSSIHMSLKTSFDFLFADAEDEDEVEVKIDTNYGNMESMYKGVPVPDEENLDTADDTYMIASDNNIANTLAANSALGAPPKPITPVGAKTAETLSKLLAKGSTDEVIYKKADRFAKADRFSKVNTGGSNFSMGQNPPSPQLERARDGVYEKGLDLRKQKVFAEEQEDTKTTVEEANVVKVKEVLGKSNELTQQAMLEEAGLAKADRLGIKGEKREFIEAVGRAKEAAPVKHVKGRNKCVCRRFKCVCNPAST